MFGNGPGYLWPLTERMIEETQSELDTQNPADGSSMTAMDTRPDLTSAGSSAS